MTQPGKLSHMQRGRRDRYHCLCCWHQHHAQWLSACTSHVLLLVIYSKREHLQNKTLKYTQCDLSTTEQQILVCISVYNWTFYYLVSLQSFMQRPVHPSFGQVKPNEDRKKYSLWIDKNVGAKNILKNHRCALKIDVNGCHMCLVFSGH